MHGEGDSYGEPFRLRPDQVLLIYEWFEYETDIDGNFVRWRYEELYLECATGYGKTEIVAALALAELCGPLAPATPNVPVAAASWDQADELLGRARQIVEHRACKLRPFIDALDTELQLKGRPGSLFRIAAVAGTNEGGVPSLFLADELHEWVGRKANLYHVVRKSLRKRRAGRLICLSTPGEDLETLAGQLHNTGINGADPKLLHKWITCDDALLPELLKDDSREIDPAILEKAIRQANPWKDDDAIADLIRDFHRMPRHKFCRYHLAKWIKIREDSWLKDQPGAWDACQGPAHFTESDPVVIWWDMSLNRDTTSVGAVQARGDGRYPVCNRTFDPADSGGRIDFLAVRDFVRAEAKRLRAKAVVYDPRFLEFEAQQLAEEGLPMVECPQSPERMVPACGRTYDLIVAGLIEQSGDPRFTAHVLGAAKRAAERGFMLSKGKSTGPIDACVGMVMGISELEHWEEPSEPAVRSLADFLEEAE